MSAPIVRMYRVDTMVAEKLEAAVTFGMINSRMEIIRTVRKRLWPSITAAGRPNP